MFKLSHKYKQHSASLYAIEYSPQLDLLFTGGGDKVVASWDLNKQENTPFSIKTNSAILNLQLMNNGNHLFIGLFNGNFHIINMESREEVKFFPYHKSGIFSSCYIAEQNLLFVGSGDGTLSIWDTQKFELIQNYKVGEGKIRAICHHENAVYIGSSEGLVFMINFEDLSKAEKFINIDSPIYCMNVLKEKSVLLIGDKNAYLHGYKLTDNERVISIPAHNWPIYSIEIISENQIATCSRDKIVKIWDAHSLEVQQRLCFPEFKGHLNSINNLKFIPKKNALISVGDDKQICVWEKV